MLKCSRAIGILLSTPSHGSFGSYWSNYAFVCVCVCLCSFMVYLFLCYKGVWSMCVLMYLNFGHLKNLSCFNKGMLAIWWGVGWFKKLLITIIMNLHQHLFISLSIVFFIYFTLFQHKSPSWIKSNLTKVKQILNL